MRLPLGWQRARSGIERALVAFGLLGCSGVRTPAPSVPAPADASPAPPAGAYFRYHPERPALMLASVALDDRRQLFAGRRGERWLFDAGRNVLEAAVPAPEDLLAIAPESGTGVWFVGRSGTSYFAATPLGPFVDMNVPLTPLARVSASGRALLGVGRDQRLMRSDDDGRTWHFAGPEGTSFVDVAMDAHGRALALATPEALWQSEDGGVHFEKSAAPATGVLGLAADPSGAGVRVTSVLGLSAWGGAAAAQRPLPSLDEVLRKGVSVPLGPDAGALAGHAAAFAGPGYVEARPRGDGKREWQLISGSLGGAFGARPLPEANGATAVVLGGFDRFVYFAVFTASPQLTQRGSLYASVDGGRSFTRVAPDFWAKVVRLRLAVGAGGALLVSGACVPSEEAPGCAPNGVLYRRPVPAERRDAPKPATDVTSVIDAVEPRGFELAAAALPSLATGAAAELAFDSDGQSAFALGPTTKGTSLALFTSSDGGRHFEAHDLGDATADQDLDAGLPFSVGRDGTLSLVLGGRRGSASLVVLDAEGRVLHVGSPPERALLGAAGLSALAIGSESGAVYESLDGGATWSDRGKLPFSLCPGDSNCDVPLRCANDGCVIGDELTRLGFGASAEPALDSYAPVEPSTDSGLERRLRTPLACTLAPGAWRSLPGVRELPDADQAAIGETGWFAVAENTKTGAVRVFHAKGGPRPRVDAVELLPALPHPEEFAQNVTPQIEGAAVVRYRLPDVRGKSARLRDVELAWDNLFENRVGRARVADAGLYTPGDFEHGSGGVESAKPDLVSIAEHGIYLRIHVRSRVDQPTLFLDGGSTLSLPAIAWPTAIPKSGHAEMAHLGADHVGLLLLARGGALARARLENGAWAFDAAGIGLPDPEVFGVAQILNITYANGQAALHVEELDERGRSAKARLFPLHGTGAVVGAPSDVPTELDLATDPLACTAGDRGQSARVVARGYPGTRHPVVVSDAVEPPRALLSGDAVLYGSRDRPCAAAFEIHPVPGGTSDPGVTEGGIVPLDDLEHAWLFRRSRESGAEGPVVEWRSMSCRFDPNLELPQEILEAPEALAPRR